MLSADGFQRLLRGVELLGFPVSSAWLLIDGSQWQGEFFGVGVPGHRHVQLTPLERPLLHWMWKPSAGQAWPLCYVDGFTEFVNLAAEAVANFVLPSFQLSNRCPLPEATLQWLGALCRMEFAVTHEHEGYFVMQFHDNVFMTSARAIERLEAAWPEAGPGAGTGRGAARRKGGSQSSAPRIPKLSERQYNMLVAMLEKGALTAASRTTTERIAAKAEGNDASPEQFKRPMAGLKKRKLVDSRGGRDGGCWLTDKGRELAELLKNTRGAKR